MRLMLCLIVGLVLSTGCAGSRARSNALLPAASAAWSGVRVDFERGVADGVSEGDLGAVGAEDLRTLADVLETSLSEGDVISLREVPWQDKMAPWAVRGIAVELAAGEVGPNGANVLLQRVSNLTAALLVLQGEVVAAAPGSRERVNPYIRTPAQRELLSAIREVQ